MLRGDDRETSGPRHGEANEVNGSCRESDDATNDYGRTRSGESISEEFAEELARKVEEGFDVNEILHRRGDRSPMGSAASMESVRLDPELRHALPERAGQEGRTKTDLIRDAIHPSERGQWTGSQSAE